MGRQSGAVFILMLATLAAPALSSSQTREEPPACVVSADPEFGLTPGAPIRVGGGAAYVAARERRYLEALRGPQGQSITYRRVLSTRSPNTERHGGGILDAYEITYEGLETPISLYLDAYQFEDPKAPQGFTCVPFAVGPPPVDPFLAMDLLVKLAIEQGTEGSFAPISLDADGTAAHGIALDRFRRIAGEARSRAEAGDPLRAQEPPADLMRLGLLLVGYPLQCDERRVLPVSIDIVPRQGTPVRPSGPPASGESLAALVPNVSLPTGALGAEFGLLTLRPQDTVAITYDGNVCTGSTRTMMLPVRYTPARPVSMPRAARPVGAAGAAAPILLQVIVALDGTFHQATYIGGPEQLAAAATESLRLWRADPARINASPVVADTLVAVGFQ